MEELKNVTALETKINQALDRAVKAFTLFAGLLPVKRAALMKAIAVKLTASSAKLVASAAKETHLAPDKLELELKRTVLQWNQYADACIAGDWLNLVIDRSTGTGVPDIRKMNRALGPVVVFGSSNFPFAYSTPGGDVASAIAAGCPVIVKAHPGHPETSLLCARLIAETIQEQELPEGVFAHIEDEGFKTGELLVKHPDTAAVAFTGSYNGGKALFDMANARHTPIPVFAEMGSINPVVLLPGAVEEAPAALAKELVTSLTGNAGQFCTNPGLWLLVKGTATDAFLAALREEIQHTTAEPMLHPGIAKQFRANREAALNAGHVGILATLETPADTLKSIPTIAQVEAAHFLEDPVLKEEVFGPYALLVTCNDTEQLATVISSLEGQLTGTIRAAATDMDAVTPILQLLEQRCGRLIFNGVPTGVTVTRAMHHGGPYPSTTDSRFTAVGEDSIRRFVRPVSYQGWPQALLPEPLRN